MRKEKMRKKNNRRAHLTPLSREVERSWEEDSRRLRRYPEEFLRAVFFSRSIEAPRPKGERRWGRLGVVSSLLSSD